MSDTGIILAIVLTLALLGAIGNALLPDTGGGVYRDPSERTTAWPGQ